MELLLFLSALLTGLTGVISGERRAEQAQVQRSASEAAVGIVAEAVAERVLPTRPIEATISLADLALPLRIWSVQTIDLPQDARLLSEKRLE